jgi:hypothetical protein
MAIEASNSTVWSDSLSHCEQGESGQKSRFAIDRAALTELKSNKIVRLAVRI